MDLTALRAELLSRPQWWGLYKILSLTAWVNQLILLKWLHGAPLSKVEWQSLKRGAERWKEHGAKCEAEHKAQTEHFIASALDPESLFLPA